MHALRLGLASRARSLAATVVSGALLLTFAWQPAAASDLGLQLPGDPALATLISAEHALLDLTNADRIANGLDPLELDPATLVIARQRAASQIDVPQLSN
jgi:hypothetical protein